MEKLVAGIHHFQETVFRPQREFYEALAGGQRPESLFITCSDSRINPNLITHTQPGELFILRNAGNIVPPHGLEAGGEAATIEYAISALGVTDLIICGHTQCGAMSGLLKPDSLKKLPAVRRWLGFAETTQRILEENYSHLPPESPEMLDAAIEENVLVQLDHLRTHPAVAAALARDAVKLHAWIYELETGDVLSYDPALGQFISLGEAYRVVCPETTVVHQI